MQQHAVLHLGEGTGFGELADAVPDAVDVRSVSRREVQPWSASVGGRAGFAELLEEVAL